MVLASRVWTLVHSAAETLLLPHQAASWCGHVVAMLDGSFVDALYDAALEPHLWQSALSRLADLMGQSSVVMATYSDSEGPRLLETVRFDATQWPQIVSEHGDPKTNRYIPMLRTSPPGQVLWPRTIMSERDWLNDPIYRKFLRPNALYDGVAAPILLEDGGFASIALFKGSEYETREVDLLQQSLPHLRHAIRVRQRLGDLSTRLETAHAVLDRLQAGVILLTQDCRPVHINAAAWQILRDADGLVLRAGTVSAAGRGHADRLDRALRSAAAPRGLVDRRARLAAGTLQIPRPSGKHPYSVLVAPLSAAALSGFRARQAAATAIAIITDPEWVQHTPAQLIAHAHGLTQAEASVVGQLVSGADLKTAADRLGVALNTAKTLLQRSFDRTGTRRQSELMARILSGPLRLLRQEDLNNEH